MTFDEWWAGRTREDWSPSADWWAAAKVLARNAWDAAAAAERERCRALALGVAFSFEEAPNMTPSGRWRVCGQTIEEAIREGKPPPPAGQYRCGCPLVACDNVKAFCPVHHKVIVPGGEPT